MLIVSQQQREAASKIRHTIRTRRNAGTLEIPTKSRVIVIAVTGGIDVNISGDSSWATVETTDPCGGLSRTTSPAARTIAQEIIGIVQDHGYWYECTVHADGLVLGTHCRD